MRFFLGMTVLVVSVMIAWWGISRQQVSEIQLSTSPLPDPPQMSATRSRAIDKLDVRITGLVQRIESLTDSITFLESKLMSAHLITDSILDAEKQLASTTMTERELMANKAEQMHGMPMPSAADSIEPAEQQAMAEAELNNETLASSAADSIEPAEQQLMAEAEQIMAEAEQILEMSPPAAGHSAGEAGAVTTHGQPSDGTMHTEPISASALHDAPDTMLSEPPAPDTDTVGSQQASNQTLVAMTRQVEVLEPEDPVSHQQPVASLDSKKGPWVINLVSTPSKSEADRLANKAESRDIETELEQVTVKGTDYWRVQITGFATADEARSYGDIAMEKLGMKDVWIMKH